jgi:hypothetical protein
LFTSLADRKSRASRNERFAATHNLGYIMRNGHLYTDATSSNVPKDLAHSYIKEVAAALGLTVTAGQTGQTWNLKSSASVPHIEQLADRLDAWVPVIERFLNTMREKFD